MAPDEAPTSLTTRVEEQRERELLERATQQMVAQWGGDFDAAELSAEIQRNDARRTGHVESDVLAELLETFELPLYGAILRRLLDSCRNAGLVECVSSPSSVRSPPSPVLSCPVLFCSPVCSVLSSATASSCRS